MFSFSIRRLLSIVAVAATIAPLPVSSLFTQNMGFYAGSSIAFASGEVFNASQQKACPFGPAGTHITDWNQTKQLVEQGLITVSATRAGATVTNTTSCHIENQAGFLYRVQKVFFPLGHAEHYTNQKLVYKVGPLGVAPGWQINLPGYSGENCAYQIDLSVGEYERGPDIVGVDETGTMPLCPLPATNNSVCSNVQVPSVLSAGAQFTATFNITNTGTKTWIAGSGLNRHMLMSANPVDNQTWGTSRISLPGSVSPGQSVSVFGYLTAPWNPGTYTLEFQMGEEGVERFGSNCSRSITVQSSNNYYPNDYNDRSSSICDIISFPTYVRSRENYSMEFRVTNNSSRTWYRDNFDFRPYDSNDNHRLNLRRMELPYDVRPGQSVVLSGIATAPNYSGYYPFEYQLAENGNRFGGICSGNISVTTTQTNHAYTNTSIYGDNNRVNVSNVQSNSNYEYITSNQDYGYNQRILPQTGVEDFTAALENTSVFLSPATAGAASQSAAGALWILGSTLFTGIGGVVTKKYLL
jgi:hypothetical protein